MTLLRDLIDIPVSVGDADFVVRAAEGADLARYVVTDALRGNFDEALTTIGHAVTSGRSQAKFLHGSFGSGKSHFMAVLREILRHNPEARALNGLAEPVAKADAWLPGKRILTLTFHMLDARSVQQAVLEGYLNQITALHPQAPVPAVHRSDALLADAAKLRATMGDEAFFATLRGEATGPGAGGGGLAAHLARQQGWTSATYAEAAAAAPGTPARDGLVSALTTTFFTGAVRSGEYLDLDTGLAVITRHAKSLGYDAMVFFLDELILWLSTRITDHTFVNTEGAKLNKLVESMDAARPLPIVSFIARQRNLEDFLGPQVGGTEREALAHVMRSVQGRIRDIVLADTNLPVITERRLLKPRDDAARQAVDAAFAAVRGNRTVWDTLLLGAQYGDAGIGSDAAAFRSLYPFSPALVATVVALSQALQRERTALRVLTELLVARRDTLKVNDLIGVAALFDPLVLHGELPDRPKLRQQFQAARDTYRLKLRPLLLAQHGITEAQAAGHELFALDDRLVRTLLLGSLVPEVPALANLTAAKLHALNFGSITSPIPGYENQIVLDRLRRLADHAGELHLTEGPDPVISVKLSAVDYDKLLDLVPNGEIATGVLQQLVRELVCADLGITGAEGTFGELDYPRDWRGRRHHVQVRFGNLRDRDNLPDSAVLASGDTWRVVIDYPFDVHGYDRRSDFRRIEDLPRGSRTVLWLPLHLTADMMGRVAQLAKVNFLLGGGGNGDRLHSLAADWAATDRQQGKVYLQQRQQQLRSSLLAALKQAYGAAKPTASDVEDDQIPVLHTVAEGLHLGDPRGGTLHDAFDHLVGDLLTWAYPGRPTLPDDERAVSRGELAKVLHYAREAAADPTRGTVVAPADRRTVQRICNPLRLGELAEHRYVLTTVTCWWSQHFLQAAAGKGKTDQFGVQMLRELLDQPAPRGFDPDLQNLIIAVFALEQQLAWYRLGGAVTVADLRGVTDDLELRHPPMPDEAAWQAAVARGADLFGEKLPDWRSPGNLAELARRLRSAAATHLEGSEKLATALEERAATLGLDPVAAAGRLATARRMAAMLRAVAPERDDVVVVKLVAMADLGGLDPKTAGKAIRSATTVANALRTAQWALLEIIVERAGEDPQAASILAELRSAAGHEQHAADLVAALRVAENAAGRLIAALRAHPVAPLPVVPPPVVPGGGADGRLPAGQVPGGGSAAVVDPGLAADPAVPVERAGAVVAPSAVDTPGVLPAGTTGAGTGEVRTASGGGAAVSGQHREIADLRELDRLAAEIRRAIEAGHQVSLTWEIR